MKLLTHSAAYFLGRVFPALIGLLGVVISTRLLDPHAVGVAAVLTSVALFGAIAFTWLRVAMFRTLGGADEVDPSMLATVCSAFIGTAVLLAPVEIVGLRLYDVHLSAALIALAVGVSLSSGGFELMLAFLQARCRVSEYGAVNLLRSVVAVAASVALIRLRWRSEALLAGLVLGNLTALVSVRHWLVALRGALSLEVARALFRFGWPTMLTGALTQMTVLFDRLLLGLFAGTAAVGIYAVAYDMSRQTVFLVIAAAALAGPPLAIRLLDTEGPGAARRQLAQNLHVIASITIPAVVALAVLAPPIANSLLGARFREDAPFAIGMIALATAFTALRTFYFDQSFELSRNTRPQALISAFAAVVGVACSALLIPRWGAVGAATSAIASTGAGVAASATWGRRVFPLPVPGRAILPAAGASLLLAVVLIQRRSQLGPVALVVDVMLGALCYVVCLVVLTLFGRPRHPTVQVPDFPRGLPSYDVFGIKLSPMTGDEIVTLLDEQISARRSCVLAYQNLHGIRVRIDDAAFRELHADANTYVHLDGMPLVALARIAGVAVARRHRVTLLDVMWPLLAHAERHGWRVYYVGSTPSVFDRGLAAIRRRCPRLTIDGHHGFFEIDDNCANGQVLAVMEQFAPDLVLVGMGMGRQERWILRNHSAFGSASVYTVGAWLEYLSGEVRTPPRWMGGLGLEWLFRLVENPRRFARRYLVEPWSVLAHVAAVALERGL